MSHPTCYGESRVVVGIPAKRHSNEPGEFRAISLNLYSTPCEDLEGGGGGQGAGLTKMCFSFSNSGPDHHKNYKTTGHHQHASETPFQWHFAGGPTAYSGMSHNHHELKKKR